MVWALEADTVEYGEWKTGVRTEGITYALFSFTRKTGQAVGGALAAYALALGGYKSGAAQTAEAVFGIQFAAGAIPAVLTIVAVAVMSKYKLTDARHAEILADIRARRESGADAAGHTDGSRRQHRRHLGRRCRRTCRQTADVHHQLTPTSYD